MNETCALCGEPVTEPLALGPTVGVMTDQGFEERPVHRECMVRSVMGGIGHHEDHAYWCLQMHDPDGGRTYHQSALEVMEIVRAQQASRFN